MMVSPPIPETGLREVLASWSGRGRLWDALAAPDDLSLERRWSPSDIRCRAHRVLLAKILPILAQWPTRLSVWFDALPAESARSYMTADAPFAGVSWPETRRLFGWPPKLFVGRATHRVADTLLVTSLRWTLEYLTVVRANATRLSPEADKDVREQLDAAQALMDLEPLASSVPVAPGRPEIAALHAEGRPWHLVAHVAEAFRVFDEAPELAAWRLLAPDDDIRWRFFHLAVTGVVLSILRDGGCRIVSRRPLGSSARGPSYLLTDTHDREWELWFEAAGIWAWHGKPSPYVAAAMGAGEVNRPLGADLFFLRPGKQALAIECKYHHKAETVTRDGYLQAVTYAVEARSRLADDTAAIVVGPTGIITGAAFADTFVGPVYILPPEYLKAPLLTFIGKL